MTIEELGLHPVAKNGAEMLVRHFPDVVFTSGRRDKWGQAKAMASNVLDAASWVRKTYIHPEPYQGIVEIRLAGLSEHFYGIMMRMSDVEVSRISKHLGGLAFDIDPTPWVNDDELNEGGKELLAFIKTVPKVEKVLTREGGLPRIHVQFFE